MTIQKERIFSQSVIPSRKRSHIEPNGKFGKIIHSQVPVGDMLVPRKASSNHLILIKDSCFCFLARQYCGQIIATSRDLTWKRWFSKGNPLISGKSRLLNYCFNLARIFEVSPSRGIRHWRGSGLGTCTLVGGRAGPSRMDFSRQFPVYWSWLDNAYRWWWGDNVI